MTRRAGKVRYPVKMPVRYRFGDSTCFTEAGHTVEMSTDRLVLETGQRPGVGTRVQVSIAWPAALSDGTRLQLVVTGAVTSVNGTRVTMDIRKHEFRTRRPWNQETPPAEETGTKTPSVFCAGASQSASSGT